MLNNTYNLFIYNIKYNICYISSSSNCVNCDSLIKLNIQRLKSIIPKNDGIRIFFLSNQNSCRSQMAEAILRSFDKDLEIYSAGIEPVDHISPVAIEVLAEIGIKLDPSVPQHYSDFDKIEFDYLITVGDGTNENLKIPPTIKFKRKMHLGFKNPYKHFKDRNELKEKCSDIRDEIYNELDYFYHRIIMKEEE